MAPSASIAATNECVLHPLTPVHVQKSVPAATNALLRYHHLRHTHTKSLLLQDYMELRSYAYERLDGSIRAEERFAAVRSFGTTAPAGQHGIAQPFVFLLTTRAGGVGLNLVAADTVCSLWEVFVTLLCHDCALPSTVIGHCGQRRPARQ